MSTAIVIPLPALLASGPPLWLDDDTTVARAVSAKPTPPSRAFWQRLAELAQIGFAITNGRQRRNCLLCAVELIDDLAAELTSCAPSDAAVHARPQPETPSRLARCDHPARAADPRLDGDAGSSATGERANAPTDTHNCAWPSTSDKPLLLGSTSRLGADTARLARVLADPYPSRPSDLAVRIDNFGITLRNLTQPPAQPPMRPVPPMVDAHAGHDPP